MGLRQEYRCLALRVVSEEDFFAFHADLSPAKEIRPTRVCLSAWQRTLLGSGAVTLWLSKKLLLAVEQSLSLGEEGPLASSQTGKLGKSLRARGLDLAEMDEEDSALKEYAAILIEGISRHAAWHEELVRLSAMLLPGARLIAVDRGTAVEVSRRFLCAGLTDIRQETVGRQVLTTGRVP